MLGSQEIGFAVAPAATGGKGKMLLFAGLLAVVVGLGGAYLLRRRRPRVKRKVVEVRSEAVVEQRHRRGEHVAA